MSYDIEDLKKRAEYAAQFISLMHKFSGMTTPFVTEDFQLVRDDVSENLLLYLYGSECPREDVISFHYEPHKGEPYAPCTAVAGTITNVFVSVRNNTSYYPTVGLFEKGAFSKTYDCLTSPLVEEELFQQSLILPESVMIGALYEEALYRHNTSIDFYYMIGHLNFSSHTYEHLDYVLEKLNEKL